MLKRLVVMVLLILVAGLVPHQASAETLEADDQRVSQQSWLMAMQSARGSIASQAGLPLSRDSRLTISMKGVEAVTAFTERPNRQTAVMRPKDLWRHWAKWFGDDEPNAVLSFASSPGSRASGSVILKLFRPRWEERTQTLSFRAQPLLALSSGEPTGNLPSTVIKPSLLIDSVSADMNLPVVTEVGPYSYRDAAERYPIVLP